MLKKLLLQGFKRIIAKFRAEKILCTFVSCTKHPFEGDTKYCAEKRLCSNTLKKIKQLKAYVSLKGNKLACFGNSKGSFQVHDLFMIS